MKLAEKLGAALKKANPEAFMTSVDEKQDPVATTSYAMPNKLENLGNDATAKQDAVTPLASKLADKLDFSQKFEDPPVQRTYQPPALNLPPIDQETPKFKKYVPDGHAISHIDDPIIPNPPETHQIYALKSRVMDSITKMSGEPLPELNAIVSIPDRKLILSQGTTILKTYPIAVGKSSTPSPEGEFKITDTDPHPGYTDYGPRWMGFLKSSGFWENTSGGVDVVPNAWYGVHGTNSRESIGKAASHGCIRMYNEQVKELYNYLHVGSPISIYNKKLSDIGYVNKIQSDED